MIVGQMSLFRFPMWEECLRDLAAHVDMLYLRFDGLLGDDDILDRIPEVAGNKLGNIFVSKSKWNPYIWREEMMRMLDKVRPEIIMVADEDEKFGDGIKEDIERFRTSKYRQMAFHYEFPMPSIDGGYMWKNKPLPSKPHVKAYRWKAGLTFIPYNGRARLSNYSKDKVFMGRSKMQHFCFYTPELRKIKLKNTKEKMDWYEKNIR